MTTINKYQRALLEGYPNIELLPMDATDDADILRAVSERSTGDGLFEFLWHELADHADDEGHDVDGTLSKAIDDIDRVRSHIALSVRPDSAPSA